jgi:hypothetical protein
MIRFVRSLGVGHIMALYLSLLVVLGLFEREQLYRHCRLVRAELFRSEQPVAAPHERVRVGLSVDAVAVVHAALGRRRSREDLSGQLVRGHGVALNQNKSNVQSFDFAIKQNTIYQGQQVGAPTVPSAAIKCQF